MYIHAVDKPYDVQPGLCVIINNMVFTKATELPDGKKDEQDLAMLFLTLGFDVRIHENLTAQEMIRKVESYSKIQHTGPFFMIILSHGTLVDNKDAVVGTDGKLVKIDRLETFFHTTNCPSLQGKPRIFIIDACRGSKKENIFKPELTDGMATKNSSANPGSPARILPEADKVHFVIVYAATHGCVAYTHNAKGSQLTQTFVEVMNDPNADPNTPFLDIIRQVGARVQESSKGHQTVETTTRMTRKYYIRYTYILYILDVFNCWFNNFSIAKQKS